MKGIYYTMQIKETPYKNYLNEFLQNYTIEELQLDREIYLSSMTEEELDADDKYEGFADIKIKDWSELDELRIEPFIRNIYGNNKKRVSRAEIYNKFSNLDYYKKIQLLITLNKYPNINGAYYFSVLGHTRNYIYLYINQNIPDYQINQRIFYSIEISDYRFLVDLYHNYNL